jgi:hypothetical protein
VADRTQQHINDPLLSVQEQKYLDNMQWSRSIHGDVSDDAEEITDQSRPSDQFIQECKDPLSCLLQILPHRFWEHVAWCTKKKRKYLLVEKSQWKEQAIDMIRSGSRNQ